ncbi:MAG: head GIN domain-containing protein [Bacteroidota bacterium]
MKRNLTIGLIVLFILSGIRLFAQDAVIKENRPVGSFSGIKVSGVAHIYLTKAETEKVNIEINNKEYNERLIVEVVNNILVIRMKPTEGSNNNNFRNLDLKIYIDYKDINSIRAGGVTHLFSQNVINAEKLDLEVSGVSNAKLEIKTKELNVQGSGTSNVTLTGSADAVNARTSGVANIKAYELSAQSVKSESSGASNIYVAVSKTISAKASGASNINYKGDPQVTNEGTSGASHIRKM